MNVSTLIEIIADKTIEVLVLAFDPLKVIKI